MRAARFQLCAYRQRNYKRGALADFGFEVDLALGVDYHILDHRKTETRAAALGGEIGREEFFTNFVRDATAIVSNTHNEFVARHFK